MDATAQHRIALVTGASSGIGLRTAVTLARAGGFFVIATMRDLGRRAALEQAVADAGMTNRVVCRQLDITRFELVPGDVERILREFGRLDALVNNAGMAVAGFADDVQLHELRWQMETNFFGHVAVTQAVLPWMRRQRSGHVIMVSSILGVTGTPAMSSYVASKFALEGWSEALRLDMHALGVRVVLVEPGAFRTDIWDRNAHLCERALDPRSPNLERSRRHIDRVQRRTSKADPQRVADLIARIAQMPDPALRYVVGRDAVMARWLRRLVPWRVYERLLLAHAGLDRL